MSDERAFEYLLNAMEHAALFEHPADHGYAEKRRAVFAYVESLEWAVRTTRELRDIEHSAETVATEITNLRRRIELGREGKTTLSEKS